MPRPIAFFAALLFASASPADGAAEGLAPYVVHPVAPITFAADEPQVPLAGNVVWLRDDSRNLTIDQVRRRDDFQSLPGNLSAGFTDAAIWLRFDIQAGSRAPLDLILEVANPVLDDVRVYEPRGDGTYTEHRSGEDIPRHLWEIDYRSPSFHLRADVPEARTYYVRLWARNTMSVKLVLWQAKAFFSATRGEAFYHGVVYGSLLLVSLFQWIFWYWTRTPLGKWYVCYVSTTLLLSAMVDGYFQRLTGLSGADSDLLLGLTSSFGLGVFATFTVRFLDLRTVMPRFARIFEPSNWVAGIATALLVMSGHIGAGVAGVTTAAAISFTVLIGVNILLALRGHQPSKVFLLAFAIFDIALITRFLSILDVVPPSLLSEKGFHVAALSHVFFMSIAITGEYNRHRRVRFKAQKAFADSLELRVRERTQILSAEISRREALEAELRRALDTEVQAHLQQQDFVAMVSHEFRTPLAIINTVTQQIAFNLDPREEKNLQRCANIRDSTRRMVGMMDSFLTFDRLSQTFHLNLTSIEPRRLINLLAMEWEIDRLEVVFENLPENIEGDAGLLLVALRNLITNAQRNSPSGTPVKLVVRGLDDGALEIRISDRGRGIPEDEIPRLFEKYFRGKASQTYPGAGLGLYLVDQIVKQHQGSVRVESNFGEGSLFVVTLPGMPAASVP